MAPRIVIVGIGSIGSRHIDTLLSMGYQDLVGVETRSMPHDERLPIVENFEDLSNWKPTHALICTPPDWHFDHARKFLADGIPVFIEKPMTIHRNAAVCLNDLAEHTGTYIAVGYMERANPAVLEAREFVRQHAIKNAYIDCYWLTTDKTYSLDVAMESSHAIDTARFILGDLKLIGYAKLKHTAHLEFVGNGTAQCYIDMNMAALLPMRRLRLYAIDGSAFELKYGLDPAEWDACYRDELQAFLDGKPLCTGDDGLKVMEVLEQLK